MKKVALVITIEGGIIQQIDSRKPLKCLIVDIDKDAEEEIISYISTTTAAPKEVNRCLKEHEERSSDDMQNRLHLCE